MVDVVFVLVSEVCVFWQVYFEICYVDLICFDLFGYFYGKCYLIDVFEKVVLGLLLKLLQNCVFFGMQGGFYKIGDYCFNDGDFDVLCCLIFGMLKFVCWEW